MAARDLTAQRAAQRLERRGGQVLVQARVRETGALFPKDRPATYRYVGRETGAAVISGPAEARWVLLTDADRASLAGHMAELTDDLNARAGTPGLVYVLDHRDELESDGGYGQIGCVLALVSTAIGLVLGIAAAWLLTSHLNIGSTVVGSIAGFLVAMYTADAVGSVLTGIPALRDRVVDLVNIYMSVVPGLITFLFIVVATSSSS